MRFVVFLRNSFLSKPVLIQHDTSTRDLDQKPLVGGNGSSQKEQRHPGSIPHHVSEKQAIFKSSLDKNTVIFYSAPQ